MSTIDFNSFRISVPRFKELLLLACSNILFSFNSSLYRQVDGMPMGSNLGPKMASFAMDMLESKMDTFVGNKPVFYRRYVDDCFLIFNRKEGIKIFFVFLNSLDDDLQFTVEMEVDNNICFLDTKISNSRDGTLSVSWYIKDTNTGIYIPSLPMDRNFQEQK